MGEDRYNKVDWSFKDDEDWTGKIGMIDWDTLRREIPDFGQQKKRKKPIRTEALDAWVAKRVHEETECVIFSIILFLFSILMGISMNV
jgi:hypothetical protein